VLNRLYTYSIDYHCNGIAIQTTTPSVIYSTLRGVPIHIR